MFYGPSGSGRKTRIAALLKAIFGNGVERQQLITKSFTTPSNTKLELSLISSNFHTELTPSDAGNYDRIVVQDIIKEIAQSQQIDSSASRKFKIVVINDADNLSKIAQAGLRRTMEKYMGNLRIILCCSSSSKIISPVRSRCLLIRVSAPEKDQIIAGMKQVLKNENNCVSDEILAKIADNCGRNMRKALLMLEAAAIDPNAKEVISVTDWELYIQSIASEMIKDQSPQRYKSYLV
jgi:replication factor C subunit 3/5